MLLAACGAGVASPRRTFTPTAVQVTDARQRVAEGRKWLVWSQGAADPASAISDARAGLTALGREYRNFARGLIDDTSLTIAIAEDREYDGDLAGAAAELQRVLRDRITLYVHAFGLE